MSAYIVTHETINAILTFAYRHPHEWDNIYLSEDGGWKTYLRTSRADMSELAQILLNENYRSVNYRYAEAETAPAIQFQEVYAAAGRTWTPVEVLKLLACYDYQACECPDYAQSTAHVLVERLQYIAIHSLPGFDAAPWGIDPAPATVEEA